MVDRQKILYWLFMLIVATVLVSIWAFSAAASSRRQVSTTTMLEEISVAHIGNSIQYYNDLPRLLEHMLQTKFRHVTQDSCLRGGATLLSLYEKGNGMANKFSSRPDVSRSEDSDGAFDVGSPTVEALLSSSSSSSSSSPSSSPWDYVIINDHTQSPARPEKKEESMTVLREKYLPLLLQQQTATTTVVFIQTAAYRRPVKDSSDLGTFDQFTEKLTEGYREYRDLIKNSGNISSTSRNNNDRQTVLEAKVAPVGLAYQYIKKHHGEHFWEMLYATDDFHPSPHGTFLEGCVIFCTIVNEYPPVHDVSWWKTARYMQPVTEDTEPLPLPTGEEANILREVAWKVCQDHRNR